MKTALDQCFYLHVVQLVMLFKVVLNYKQWIKPLCLTVSLRAIEQKCRAVMFVILYSLSQLKSLNNSLVRDHLFQGYGEVLSCSGRFVI